MQQHSRTREISVTRGVGARSRGDVELSSDGLIFAKTDDPNHCQLLAKLRSAEK